MVCISDPLNMSLQPCTAHESLKTLLQVAGPKTPPMPPPGAPAPVAPPMLDLGIAVKSEVEDDDGDAGHQWTEEEWKAWENWDGYEEVKEEIEEIEEEGFGEYGHDAPHEPLEEPEEEIAETSKREALEPPPKKPRSHGDDDTGYYSGQWNDSSWWDGPWKWNQWGWKDYNQQQWSPRAWQGKSSSSSSHKAPWAFTKGKKGKGKSKGKAKQDRWGGTYVKGGYTSPDGTFYQYLDDLIGIPLDLDCVTDFHVFGVEVAY